MGFPTSGLDRHQLFGTPTRRFIVWRLPSRNIDQDHGRTKPGEGEESDEGEDDIMPKNVPMNIPMRPRARNILAFVFLLLTGSPVFAQTARYELFPEPDVRQNATNRSASAYVVDKKNNQFWICTARYNFRDLTANNGECVEVPLDIGRPSISETYNARPVIGSAPISAFLPVIWFIEPATGAMQFCAIRHAGSCVQLTLPRSDSTTGQLPQAPSGNPNN